MRQTKFPFINFENPLYFSHFFQIKSGNPKNAPILKILVILCPELTIQWDKGSKQLT